MLFLQWREQSAFGVHARSMNERFGMVKVTQFAAGASADRLPVARTTPYDTDDLKCIGQIKPMRCRDFV